VLPNPTDTTPPAPATRRRGLLSRFRRADDGAFAIEFGFIAPLFLGLIFGILEVALTFWSTQILETAVANAARSIYTGSFQSGTASSTPAEQQAALKKFKDAVCANVAGVFDCKARVSVDVQRFTSFSGTTITPPVKNGVYDVSSYGYNPPGANEICVVRASLEYPVFVNLFGYSTGLRSGNRLIMASSTFRTEPYQ
jgi:Flp pilus assembly protein TadG